MTNSLLPERSSSSSTTPAARPCSADLTCASTKPSLPTGICCWVERICLGWHLVCVLFYTQVIKLANSHLSTGPPESPPKLRVSDPHWFNADPDPEFFLIADPDPDPGFDDLKLTKNIQLEIKFLFYWSKIGIYLSLGLHKGRPSNRRSLQPWKENIQHFKTWKLCPFSIFVEFFCPPGSGSGSAIWMRIRIQQLKLIRIRIRNPVSSSPSPTPFSLFCGSALYLHIYGSLCHERSTGRYGI